MGRKRAMEETCDGKGGRSYFPLNNELDELLVNCILNIADDKKELRGLSGAGWDDVKKMVDINDILYAEYVAKQSHCAKQIRVPFTCYDGLERCLERNDDDDDIAELKPAIEETMTSLNAMLGEAGTANRQRTMLYTSWRKLMVFLRTKWWTLSMLRKVFGKVCSTGKSVVGPEELEQVCPKIEWNNLRFGDNQSSPTEQPRQNYEENPTPEAIPNQLICCCSSVYFVHWLFWKEVVILEH
ncbi:hypothetical protein LINPERPRIM_LOCUS30610 [Linum perenne]